MSDIQGADPRLKDWMIAPAHELDELRQTTEAWNRGEFERWIAESAPDCEWYPTTEGGLLGEATPIRGHDGLRAFAREAHELWEHFHLEVTDLLRRRRLSLMVGQWAARGRLSGVEVATPMFWVMETNDAGKRTWAKSFVDLDDALSAAAERDATIDAMPRD